MTDPKPTESEESRFTRALLQLNTKLLGFVMGVIFAMIIFVATLWLVVMGGHVDDSGQTVVGPHLALLGIFFIGYKVTVFGSFIGAFYGFAIGSIAGTAIGKIYNKLSMLRMPANYEPRSRW